MGSACPDPAELDALVIGRLDAARRPALEAHLDGCAECADVVATMLRLFASSPALLANATTIGRTSAPPPGAASATPPRCTSLPGPRLRRR